jgi:hypothetical protein
MYVMAKYFDNTFFKFLFGFLGILGVSFTLLYITQYFGTKCNPEIVYADPKCFEETNITQ